MPDEVQTATDTPEIPSQRTRAKFKLTTINGNQVTMNPVYSDTPENKKFWDATPAGAIQLTIITQAALANFQTGKDYLVDFTPAD